MVICTPFSDREWPIVKTMTKIKTNRILIISEYAENVKNTQTAVSGLAHEGIKGLTCPKQNTYPKQNNPLT